MRASNQRKIVGAVMMLVTAVLALGLCPQAWLYAQDAGSQSQGQNVEIDEYDRTAQVWYYQRMGKGGWERGQEIYYMKCWMCHNDYTRTAEAVNNPALAAPTLRDLYKRGKMMNGEPVTDEAVKRKIKGTVGRMPSYEAVLTEKDLDDLVAYLREKCCWDEMNPPPNPRYKQ